MKSLLGQLPSIVAEGKREVERVMERAESNFRLCLQRRELVIPSEDSNWQDLWRQAIKREPSDERRAKHPQQADLRRQPSRERRSFSRRQQEWAAALQGV